MGPLGGGEGAQRPPVGVAGRPGTMRGSWRGGLALALVVVAGLTGEASSFALAPRLPLARLGVRGCPCRRRAVGLRMCEADGKEGGEGLSSKGRPGERKGVDDAAGGGVGVREVPTQPEEVPEDVVVKTEMWKELWIRNVAHADTARRRTSEFFSECFGGLRSMLPPAASAAADHYEEVLVTSIGYDQEGQGQIVEYDPAFLSRIGWLTNLKGTVFYVGPLYWQLTWLMAIATVYALLSGPAPLVLDTMGLVPASAATKLTLRLPSLKAQTFAVSLVGGLLSFLLSLFNSNGLDRWWKTRDCLGIVIGKSIDIAMMFSMYIRGYDKESDKRAQEYKKELIRYVNLAHILVYRQANSIDDLSDLENDHSYNPPRCWITKDEINLFQPESKPQQLGEAVRRRKFFAQQLEARPRVNSGRKRSLHSHAGRPAPPKAGPIGSMGTVTNRGVPVGGGGGGGLPSSASDAERPPIAAYEPVQPQTAPDAGGYKPLVQALPGAEGGLISRYVVVYYWIEELLSKASREGLIDRNRPEALWKMQENISKMRGAAADVFMYLYCKIPYIYVHLMTVLVKVYLIVIAAVAGSSMRMAWFLSRPADFIAAILMVFFMNLVYEGLLQIHIRLWNPLGFDINDYPQRRYQDYVWRATMQFLRKPEDILPPYMIPNTGLFAKAPIPDPVQPTHVNGKEEKKAEEEEGVVLVPFGEPTI